ncbi:putative BOI-related E3 ubiquitin-protein ligase 3 [Silene latifolia]|uniref:putative BOI-related E3 ubiquitin-protein ligase 3 n=1 Tax=Silene latifolia TaxID=37657 RepID=UPI003D77C543
MAVDQAKYMNFFTEILPSNNNNINNTNIMNNHQFYGNNVIPLNTGINESFRPVYNLNDVVYNQKQQLTPAVKDDSGITFNNTLVPPPTQPPSRKRSRDPISISCVAPPPHQLLTMHHPVSKPSTTTTTANTSINLIHNDNLSPSFAFLGQDLSLQIMQQDLEFHRLISNHMERMKVEIEERKKEQLRRIMGAMEESLGRRLRDKEEELTKIGRINYALEEKVKSLCLENQIWRDLAQTNEATANALRTNLEQLLQQMKDNAERKAAAEEVDDAVSCCGSGGDEDNVGDSHEWLKKRKLVEDGQNGWIYRGKSGGNGNSQDNNNHNEGNGRLCRKCGEAESSVLLLPCRHLCLCTTCGPAVNSCPICDTVKNASVHVNLS